MCTYFEFTAVQTHAHTQRSNIMYCVLTPQVKEVEERLASQYERRLKEPSHETASAVKSQPQHCKRCQRQLVSNSHSSNPPVTVSWSSPVAITTSRVSPRGETGRDHRHRTGTALAMGKNSTNSSSSTSGSGKGSFSGDKVVSKTGSSKTSSIKDKTRSIRGKTGSIRGKTGSTRSKTTSLSKVIEHKS